MQKTSVGAASGEVLLLLLLLLVSLLQALQLKLALASVTALQLEQKYFVCPSPASRAVRGETHGADRRLAAWLFVQRQSAEACSCRICIASASASCIGVCCCCCCCGCPFFPCPLRFGEVGAVLSRAMHKKVCSPLALCRIKANTPVPLLLASLSPSRSVVRSSQMHCSKCCQVRSASAAFSSARVLRAVNHWVIITPGMPAINEGYSVK